MKLWKDWSGTAIFIWRLCGLSKDGRQRRVVTVRRRETRSSVMVLEIPDEIGITRFRLEFLGRKERHNGEYTQASD